MRGTLSTSINAVRHDSLGDSLGRLGRAVAGVGLIVAIIAAPWMYGSTRHWAIVRLCEILSVTTLCWLGAVAVERRNPRIPRGALFATAFLLIAGWLGVMFEPVLPPDRFSTEHFLHLSAMWPGSFVIKSPAETMWLMTGILGAFLVTMDLTANPRWWKAVYVAFALVGASIIVLGLIQVVTGAKAILWKSDVPTMGFFFGTYFHHSHGGAFVNLVWPLAAGLFMASISSRSMHGFWRAAGSIFWGMLLLIGLCGPFALVSRFAQLNAVLLVVAVFAWFLWRLGKSASRKAALGLVVGVLIFGPVLGWAATRMGRLPSIVERWQLFAPPRTPATPAERRVEFRLRPDGFIQSEGGDDRVVGAVVCLRMLPYAGLLGFGPGSWSRVYPHFTDNPSLRSFFLWLQFAHNDALQAMVEWGILGAAAWFFLILSGLGRATRRLRWAARIGASLTAREVMTAAIVTALAGVLLHGMGDSPMQIPSLALHFMILLALAWKSAPSPILPPAQHHDTAPE